VGLEPLNNWGNGDAGGLEGRGAVAANIRPQQEVLIVMNDLGQPQGLEVGTLCFVRAGFCRGLPAEPGSAAMGTLGVPIGCPAGRGHGWPALPIASCKGRGVCPSCNGRRMAQTAAHLVDRVIPPVPVRQWVVSVPKRLRGFLADRPQAVAALTRIFLSEIERLLCAERLLCEAAGGSCGDDAPAAPRPRPGAVSFLHRFLDADVAADMLARENSGFSVDASVRITLIDRDVPSYFQSLEHLLRYCARPPFALERLSIRRGADGRIAKVRYVLPRHKAANWVGPGRGRKSTRPGAGGVIELSPFEFLDRLADLVPPPRKHRHRYHGVFAPNHPLRPAVTALAVGNVGKQRDATTGRHADGRHAAEGCCNTHEKPRSHDTSRIAWAKLMARVGEEFPLECPNCGGDIRLISFITEPGPIRKILAHLGEPLEPPPISPARGPPTDWGELVQVHDDRDVFQGQIDELPAIDIHSL
jgi:hypothetical protein